MSNRKCIYKINLHGRDIQNRFAGILLPFILLLLFLVNFRFSHQNEVQELKRTKIDFFLFSLLKWNINLFSYQRRLSRRRKNKMKNVHLSLPRLYKWNNDSVVCCTTNRKMSAKSVRLEKNVSIQRDCLFFC